MNFSENSAVQFLLYNDVYGESALTSEEFFEFQNKFYNKDLSGLRSLSLWELSDFVSDKKSAEKIYSALHKNYNDFFKKLSENDIRILCQTDSDYPVRIAKKLEKTAPPVIYTAGDTSLLNKRSAAVTGSRKTSEKGLKFSYDIGETIALENKILVSGGARGCDRKATENAIKNGGKAVWFCAVPLSEMLADKSIFNWVKNGSLCLCSDFNPFGKFSGKQALRRNRYIYANAETAFVCQCNSKISGTYSGANYALKNKLCEIFIYDNDTEADKLLIKNGAIAIVDK